MTVSSTTNRKSFTGDAVTTSFGTSPVVFFNTSELVVQVVTTATGAATTLVENTDYTVTGGSGSTGTVDLSGGSSPYGAPAATETLVILRVLPFTQADDFVNNDINDAEVLEDRLDKITMLLQQLDEVDDRSLKLSSAETATSALTELPFDRASKFLAFDASKNLIAAAATDSGVVTSAFMSTVLDDTTAANARTTLGAAASGANSDITSLTAVAALTNAAGIDIKGTNTNDDAAAGYVGEYISSTVASGSAVSLTTATPANVTSIALTAGDWDVSAVVGFTPAATTSVTALISSISTTTATHALPPERAQIATAAQVPNAQSMLTPPTTRLSLSGNTTVYLVASANFTVDTMAAFGRISARRVR